MKPDSASVIEKLRNEVQEYGGLLGLFNEQQKAILQRQPDVVLTTQDAIVAQLQAINQCRKEREAVVKELAFTLAQPVETALRPLLEFFPETVRPLLQALIDEVNHLISRTKRRARQNQMLLSRSIEVSQQILQRLNPDAMTKTYSPRGRVSLAAAGVASRYLARS